jgi:hypothetical protein
MSIWISCPSLHFHVHQDIDILRDCHLHPSAVTSSALQSLTFHASNSFPFLPLLLSWCISYHLTCVPASHLWLHDCFHLSWEWLLWSIPLTVPDGARETLSGSLLSTELPLSLHRGFHRNHISLSLQSILQSHRVLQAEGLCFRNMLHALAHSMLSVCTVPAHPHLQEALYMGEFQWYFVFSPSMDILTKPSPSSFYLCDIDHILTYMMFI